MRNAQPRTTVNRREFLGRSVGGALAVAVGGLPPPSRLAAGDSGKNPFAYDLDKYRKVDPRLVHYERVGRFRSPQPEPRRIAISADDRLYLAASKYVTVLDREGVRLSEMACVAPVRSLTVAGDGTL